MIDVGSTSDFVLMSLDVFFSTFEYLCIDWDSELGHRIRELSIGISNALPDVVVLNEIAV